MMKKFLLSFLLFVCCFTLTLQSHAAVMPDTSEIREGIRFSECVRPYNGGVLIANYGSQHKMPGIDEIKGYILYRKNGQTKTLIPPGLLHYPSGIAVKDDYLFVCDGDHLRVYNLQQPEKAPKHRFPPRRPIRNRCAPRYGRAFRQEAAAAAGIHPPAGHAYPRRFSRGACAP